MNTMIYFLLSTIVFFNAVFFIMAVHEFYISGKNKPSWVTCSQECEPQPPNGKPSVVLVHGFVGSPFDFKELANELCRSGFRVVVPCMPGQGSGDFAYTRGRLTVFSYISWLEEILKNEQKKTGMKPFLAGFSMGGTLSLILSSRGLSGKLVLIAPFFDLPRPGFSSFVSTLGWVFPVIPKTGRGKIYDPKAYSQYIPGSMLVSIPAFRKLKELAQMAEKAIADLPVPVFIICSKNDQVASYDRIRQLFKNRTGMDIREYNKGNHILLHDFQKADLIRDVRDFFLS